MLPDFIPTSERANVYNHTIQYIYIYIEKNPVKEIRLKNLWGLNRLLDNLKWSILEYQEIWLHQSLHFGYITYLVIMWYHEIQFFNKRL